MNEKHIMNIQDRKIKLGKSGDTNKAENMKNLPKKRKYVLGRKFRICFSMCSINCKSDLITHNTIAV